jgi:hypothetical protein
MKNKETNTTVTGGIGFCGLLTIVFIVLKLLNKISWSWIWVLAPLWIEFIVAVLTVIIIIIGVTRK